MTTPTDPKPEHTSKDIHEAIHRLFSLAGFAWDDGNDPTGWNAVYNLDEICETMKGLYADRTDSAAALRLAREALEAAEEAESLFDSAHDDEMINEAEARMDRASKLRTAALAALPPKS